MKKRQSKTTKPSLDGFRAWLGELGLMDGTIDQYSSNLKNALDEGILSRLRDDVLAPKTKRGILAACRRWAEYTRDEPLALQLKKIRLPPARRRKAKLPLARQQLFDLIDEIEKAPYLTEVMRGILGMMACRGLRVGDVLRLRRDELKRAQEDGVLSFEAKGRRRLEFKVLRAFRASLARLATAPGDWTRVDEIVSPRAKPKGRRDAAARQVERALVRVGVHAGITGLHPHRLRRTYSVEYLRALAGDPEAIMKLQQHMQWASAQTAMEYVDHARGAELDEPAEKIFERDP